MRGTTISTCYTSRKLSACWKIKLFQELIDSWQEQQQQKIWITWEFPKAQSLIRKHKRDSKIYITNNLTNLKITLIRHETSLRSWTTTIMIGFLFKNTQLHSRRWMLNFPTPHRSILTKSDHIVAGYNLYREYNTIVVLYYETINLRRLMTRSL